MRSLLLALLMPAAVWSQAVTLAKPDEPLPAAMMEWAEAQKDLPDMVVGFRQTRNLPALKQPVVSQGRFWRFRDGAFRWELGDTSQAVTVLVHDAREFRVREAPDSPWKELDENDARYRMWARFLSGREASPEELNRHFLVKESEDTPGISTITLRPKAPFVKRHLKQLDLQISRANKRLVQLRILQGDGATVLMQFDEPKPVSAPEKAAALAR
ncbi:MAG: outer membrane lipoprotein carrier protein LolA [Verrucomicrobiota bacterium]